MRSRFRKLKWTSADLQNPSERDELLRQEQDRAAERVGAAFARLMKQGILDKNGKLLTDKLPADMEPGAERDVGG